jgi:SNF2 family DNA or RNA helicase
LLKPRSDLRLDARHGGYAYQIDAVEALRKLPYSAVFHEQGLGKTKIGIDLALEWLKSNEIDSVIFVTKRSLIENWSEEIRAHTFVAPRVLAQNHASNFFAFNSPIRIYLTHYEVIKSEERRLALFLKTRRVAAILDEAQKIKNPDTALAQSLHKLGPQFTRRVIMTGTPIANRPYDLWSQVYFLDAGSSLGPNFEEFQQTLDLSNDLWEDARKKEAFETALTGIFTKIKSFTVRETKLSAGIELPEKHIENVAVEAGEQQRKLYDSFRFDLGAEILRDGKVVQDDAEELLKRMLRLVQVASNPILVDKSYTETPGKFPKLLELVEKASADGSKTIVWTSFIENAEWLSKKLQVYRPAVVHGGKAMDDRNKAIRSFKNDADCQILIATPGSAKEGLTLTIANHAIFYDRSFSLDDYLQAQDRIHRISQKQTCYVWNLICKDSVDEWVDMLLSAKRLAAQLAQADISPEEYQRRANYDFGKIIKQILGNEGGHG